MGNTTYDVVTRLVWGENEEEAIKALHATLDRPDPYGWGSEIEAVELHEAMGTP